MGLAAALLVALAVSPLPEDSVRMPGSAPAERPVWREPGNWPTRRNRLAVGVALSSAAVTAGALALVLPGVGQGGGTGDAECGTPYIGSLIAGPTLITVGSVATVITATVLSHHRRWDRPRPIGDQHTRTPAAVRTRKRLRIALGVFAGLAVAGGASIGLGYAAAVRGCHHDDMSCSTRVASIGYLVGGPLILTGAFGSLSSGILLGLHRRHRHDLGPRIEPAAGGLALRF